MKDTGMSLQLSKLIDEGGDQTITAAQFLKIGEELLNNSNQISKGYSSAVASTNLGDLAGAAKAGNEITPDVTAVDDAITLEFYTFNSDMFFFVTISVFIEIRFTVSV